MGLLLSRFRRKKTTFQVLEELEKEIRSIEQYGYSTEAKRRRVVGTLMAVSIGLYVLSVILFYFYFRLTSWKEILLYATPLLVFPVVIVLLRAGLSRYYEWKLHKNKSKLIDMRAEKKKILEEVMDKETYKFAKQILDKFGEPKDTVLATETPKKLLVHAPSTALVSVSPAQLRQRQVGMIANVNTLNASSALMPRSPYGPNTPSYSNELTPMKRNQLPRPVLPAGGGAFDRLVDYLVGDGPGSRFALICSKCMGHNGMALPEEFEYLSYRCAHCRWLNPARKQKPKAPPLVTTPIRTPSVPIKEKNVNSSSDSDCSYDDKKIDKVDSDTDVSVTQEEETQEEDAQSTETETADVVKNGEVVKDESATVD
ncbi:zinc-ribbon metal-binding protein lunapark [Arctopsyche grandis]|uniref:zinc-ribbon metal-binding protein lunapark n=1 Tax=Arctopsyche grandis TaxID=121162 RepID=UPI00406D7FA8